MDYLFGVRDCSEDVDQNQHIDQFEHNEIGIAPRKWRASDVRSFFRVQVD